MRLFGTTRRLPGTRLVIMAVPLLLLGAPAGADVRIGHEATGANYRVSVLSWWEIPFRTVIRQNYDFSCGSASLATLLTFHYGRPTSEREAFVRMWSLGDRDRIRREGFSMFEMRNFLKALGYRAEGFQLKVDDLPKIRRPMIVLLENNGFKHFVVTKGFRNGKVLVGDPMRGLGEYTTEQFDKVWNGYALAILSTPDERRPKFNLAGDWGPWSRAPLQSGQTRVAVNDLTGNLPPAYQISPQILLDVRVGTVR